MMTWLQAWPLLGLPVLLVSLLAAVPDITMNAHTFGGGPFRQWFLNHCLLPVLPLLPSPWESNLLTWYPHAGVLDKWLLVALVALNLNALLLPALYWLVGRLIALSGWLSSKSHELKTNAVRR